ncbi:MAG: PKD domain-containing protein [Candidatus Thermoplasmatota archaeon]
MNKSRKILSYMEVFIILFSMGSMVLISFDSHALQIGPEITITTDQLEYYPGEQVSISGRILNDGQGVPSSPLCVHVNDSEANMIFGTCGLSNNYGNYTFTFSLDEYALLGTYHAEAHSYQFDIKTTTSFEVVSTVVIVEISGPCNGVTGVPVSFFGSATGGKKPYSWLWNFGDQQISAEQNPHHIYSAPGNYTVVLTVTDTDGHTGTDLLLITILPGENQTPNQPMISGPSSGKIKTEYTYNLSAVDPDGDQVYFWVEWCENCAEPQWIGPYDSGEIVPVQHAWEKKGMYTIRLRAKDTMGAESAWTTFEVSMPKENRIFRSMFFWFLKSRFPRFFG